MSPLLRWMRTTWSLCGWHLTSERCAVPCLPHPVLCFKSACTSCNKIEALCMGQTSVIAGKCCAYFGRAHGCFLHNFVDNTPGSERGCWLAWPNMHSWHFSWTCTCIPPDLLTDERCHLCQAIHAFQRKGFL
eukprot:scaffold71228_cov20-Tisochrysis_lutea.AAC.1